MELFNEVNGCCPFCGNKANIIEGMIFEYNLNKEGYPENLISESYKVTAYCKYCSRQLFAYPNGSGGYNVYPYDPGFILEKLNTVYKDSIPRISITANKILESTSTEINPFVNVRDYLESAEEEKETILEEDIPF